MVNHLITVDDNFSLQTEVLAKLNNQLKDPASVLGTQHRAQILAEAARLPWLGAYLRNGVLNTSASPFQITKTAGTNLTFTIDPGKAVFAPYGLETTAVATLTCDPVTTARTDLVIIRSYDTGAGFNALTYDQIEIVRGTTTADPALPARSIVLWRINLTTNATLFTVAGGTNDLRKFTAPPGGTVRIIADADAAGLPVGTPLYDTVLGLGKVINLTGAVEWASGNVRYNISHTQQITQTFINGGVTLQIYSYTYTGVPTGGKATVNGSVYLYTAGNSAGYLYTEIAGVVVGTSYFHSNYRAFAGFFPVSGSRQIATPAGGNVICRIVYEASPGSAQIEVNHINTRLEIS